MSSRSLLLDGLDYMGMAVAGGGHGDAGGEVEELVAVHVGNDDAASALGDHGIGAGVGRGNILLIAREHALGVGAGQGSLDFGTDGCGLCCGLGCSLGCGHGFRGHGGILRGRGSLVAGLSSLAVGPSVHAGVQNSATGRAWRIGGLVATEETGTKTRRKIRAITARAHQAVQPAFGGLGVGQRIGIVAQHRRTRTSLTDYSW